MILIFLSAQTSPQYINSWLENICKHYELNITFKYCSDIKSSSSLDLIFKKFYLKSFDLKENWLMLMKFSVMVKNSAPLQINNY